MHILSMFFHKMSGEIPCVYTFPPWWEPEGVNWIEIADTESISLVDDADIANLSDFEDSELEN